MEILKLGEVDQPQRWQSVRGEAKIQTVLQKQCSACALRCLPISQAMTQGKWFVEHLVHSRSGVLHFKYMVVFNLYNPPQTHEIYMVASNLYKLPNP